MEIYGEADPECPPATLHATLPMFPNDASMAPAYFDGLMGWLVETGQVAAGTAVSAGTGVASGTAVAGGTAVAAGAGVGSGVGFFSGIGCTKPPKCRW